MDCSSIFQEYNLKEMKIRKQAENTRRDFQRVRKFYDWIGLGERIKPFADKLEKETREKDIQEMKQLQMLFRDLSRNCPLEAHNHLLGLEILMHEHSFINS